MRAYCIFFTFMSIISVVTEVHSILKNKPAVQATDGVKASVFAFWLVTAMWGAVVSF